MKITDEHRDPFTIVGPDGIDLEVQWIADEGDEVIGLLAHHPYEQQNEGRWPECGGGGYIAWKQTPITRSAKHQLVAGGPGDEANLTIAPSLWHRAKGHTEAEPRNSPHHGCHGFIRAGKWEVV